MDINALYIVVCILTASLILNLKLTFNILALLRKLPLSDTVPLTPHVGELLQVSAAKLINSHKKILFNQDELPSVLIFLSSKCPKCQEKLGEIHNLQTARKHAGLNMWLVSTEPAWRLRKFLHHTTLADMTVLLSKKDYKALNPRMSSPFYLFIDHLGRLEAGGMIGDEDWLSFIAQINELKTTEAIYEPEPSN